jgi:hypothetical protein
MWVYVGGLPRSGQTLLAHLIGLHPECQGFGQQTQWVHDLLQLLAPLRDERGYKVQYVLAHDAAGLQRDNTLPVLLQYKDLWEVAGAILSGIESLWPDARYLVTGSPTNLETEPLRRLRPDARFILTERPEKDCVASVRNTHWGSSLTAAEAADFIGRYVPYAESLRKQDGVLCVDHAAVQDDHAATLRTVLDWLELDATQYPWEVAAQRFAAGAAYIS